MRILSVSDFYPPVIGGMERLVQSLSRELAFRGHDVSVATGERRDSPRHEVDEGVRVHRVPGISRILRPFYDDPERSFPVTLPDPALMLSLGRVIRAERPDIIHCHGWILYSALPLKRMSRAGLVVSLHDYGLVCPKRTFVHGGHWCEGPQYLKCVQCAADAMGTAKSLGLTTGLHLSRPLHARADRFIAVSEAVAEASIRPAGTGAGRVEVIPSFIPDRVVEVAREASRPKFVPPTGEYLLFVGGLGPNKGLDILLAALARLASPVPLVVIATPPIGRTARMPPGVSVVEGADHEDVIRAWAHCVIGVVPSTWAEPFGLVAIEAMACGKPVIASDIGGLKDIVLDGETGVLVPPADPDALSQALDSLLGDPRRRAAMGAAGRLRATQFFASRITDRFEAVYRDVLSERTASSAKTSS